MSEPTLIDKRTQRPFRSFQARASWMGDEDFSGHLTKEQLEAIKAMTERKPLTIPYSPKKLLRWSLFCFVVVTVILWLAVS